MWFVYILKLNNGNYYKGCTNDLDNRITKHQQGKVPSTCENIPVELVSYTAFADKHKAFMFEKYLKSGSGRAFLRKRLV
jgi:predicted GIY-YIG superfamily endonuclease